MQHVIENEKLTVMASTLGAELCAIRDKDGTDYLCSAERSGWGGSAPVLFPNTGWVKDGYALIEGKQYPYTQHGFAKTSQFVLHEKRTESMTFLLRWSEATLTRYPWRFTLAITYQLDGNRLWTKTNIQNEDTRSLYASLGFHPGFACPILLTERVEEYELSFPQPMTGNRLLLQDAMVAGHVERFWNGITKIPITEGMFDGGSYTMTSLSTQGIRLASKQSGKGVELSLGDYPVLVIWAPKHQPITTICMEPWYGLPDALDDDHRPEAKPYTLCIVPGKEKALTFAMTFY